MGWFTSSCNQSWKRYHSRNMGHQNVPWTMLNLILHQHFTAALTSKHCVPPLNTCRFPFPSSRDNMLILCSFTVFTGLESITVRFIFSISPSLDAQVLVLTSQRVYICCAWWQYVCLLRIPLKCFFPQSQHSVCKLRLLLAWLPWKCTTNHV